MGQIVTPGCGRTFMITKEVISRYVKPKKGEQVVIIADTESDASAVQAVAATCHVFEADPVIMIMSPTFLGGHERYMPPTIIKALEEADIMIPMTVTTGHSCHDPEVSAALHDKTRKKNLRLFAFAGWHAGSIDSALDVLRTQDQDEIMKINKQFEQYFHGAKEIRVTTELGTDLVASIEDITYRSTCSLALEPGESGGLIVGEVFGGPAEFTAEGTLVLDGAMARILENRGKPFLDEPIRMTIKKGRVTDVQEGGYETDIFKDYIYSIKDADVLAEISIATNPYLTLNGNCNGNDKWVLGVIHVAFGQNTFQIWPHGTVDCAVHTDAVIHKPSVWVDGKQILDKGVPLVLDRPPKK